MTGAGTGDTRRPSPGAARRRLGNELRALREASGLKLDVAARHLQRSPATVSRLEGARVMVPRLVDIAALLELYSAHNAQSVTPEMRERILRLAADSLRKQWFEPFRDVMTGDMTEEHVARLVEYETDASQLRSYQPEIVPGLLQTKAYALAVAEAYFPGHGKQELTRFVEFRLARQAILMRERDPVRFSVVVGEAALRRPFGGSAVLREQLMTLVDVLRGTRPNVEAWIVPVSATLPAALGGPFMVVAFDADDEADLVYLESRSGGDYLLSAADVERFNLYFDSLVEAALPGDQSVGFVANLVDELD